MRPRIIVLTTGGTIAHRSGTDGVAVMQFDPKSLVAEIGLAQVDAEFRSVLHKGSADIVPDDWVVIAQAVADAASSEPRGVVVLHGTDTMHYTAAALSFMLSGLGLPVAVTGSMVPGGDSGGDAIPNLRDAIVVAAQADFAEVCVVFSADAERTRGVVIRGCRARKTHSHAVDAFSSINAPPIGFVANGRIVRSDLEVRRRGPVAPRLATSLDRDVVLVKLTPGLTPERLARCLDGASGAVLEGTGVGHVRTDLQPVVVRFQRPVVVTTQAAYGGERLGSYDIDRAVLAIPNVIPAADMSSETALVKLMWALKQPGDVKTLMRTNIAGEIFAPGALSFRGRPKAGARNPEP